MHDTVQSEQDFPYGPNVSRFSSRQDFLCTPATALTHFPWNSKMLRRVTRSTDAALGAFNLSVTPARYTLLVYLAKSRFPCCKMENTLHYRSLLSTDSCTPRTEFLMCFKQIAYWNYFNPVEPEKRISIVTWFSARTRTPTDIFPFYISDV